MVVNSYSAHGNERIIKKKDIMETTNCPITTVTNAATSNITETLLLYIYIYQSCYEVLL